MKKRLMAETEEYNINELNLEMILPNSKTFRKSDSTGSKIVIIGKPKTGKSTLLKALLYAKRDIFPVGIFFSGTEKFNHFYKEFVPKLFIYDEYNEDALRSFKKRQEFSKKYCKNPWAVCVLDDCTANTSVFKGELQNDLYKNGRHWKMLEILMLQYAIDIPPPIRNSIDGTFILRESNIGMREKLYKNFCGIIPSFDLFKALMDRLTDDFTAIYIDNLTDTNDWTKCVYFYKGKIVTDKEYKFGCPQYRDYHFFKYNPEVDDGTQPSSTV